MRINELLIVKMFGKNIKSPPLFGYGRDGLTYNQGHKLVSTQYCQQLAKELLDMYAILWWEHLSKF